jgi:hypothetical protein
MQLWQLMIQNTWISVIRSVWVSVDSVINEVADCPNTTRASAYWPQIGRMYHTYEAIRQNEVMGEFRYKWIVRLRCDLLNTPSLNIKFETLPHIVHISGSWHIWGRNRRPTQFLTRDYFFLVPRNKADNFFSVSLNFLMCQSHSLNFNVCQVEKWIMFPECILKTHLHTCNISYKIMN